MSQQLSSVSRRVFTKLGVAAASGFGLSEALLEAQRSLELPGPLRSEFLMHLRIETTGADVGGRSAGIAGRSRSTGAITGAWFEGPKLKGKVLQPSGIWAMSRPDGSNFMDGRVTLRTDDDQRIYMSYQGIQVAKATPPYWRTCARFEAGTDKYEWMNTIIAVGIGHFPAPPGNYYYYQILWP